MQKECEYSYGLCNVADYDRFDTVMASELRHQIKADQILNHGELTIPFSLSDINADADSRIVDYLSILRKRFGTYFIWCDEGFDCNDHERSVVRCIYVGKGPTEKRLTSHLRKKKELADETLLYLTTYECKNRLAKYIEQLFLDTWNFDLNKDENPGTGDLFGYFTHEQIMPPDLLHHLSNRLPDT